MLAADAKKAGTASAETRRTPIPPSLTGRVAWVHWISDSLELVMMLLLLLLLLGRSPTLIAFPVTGAVTAWFPVTLEGRALYVVDM